MKWAVIEMAGYVGEHNIGGTWDSQADAERYVRQHYDRDEIEDLHVDIAHWDEEGGFWSYDH